MNLPSTEPGESLHTTHPAQTQKVFVPPKLRQNDFGVRLAAALSLTGEVELDINDSATHQAFIVAYRSIGDTIGYERFQFAVYLTDYTRKTSYVVYEIISALIAHGQFEVVGEGRVSCSMPEVRARNTIAAQTFGGDTAWMHAAHEFLEALR